jgi:SLOG cluster2
VTDSEATRPPLAGVLVGVSISDSPDLLSRGLDKLHQQHAFVEAVRHILAAGGSVAYGGDLRAGGYTEALFDLVRTYDLPGELGTERVRSYLAWPLYDRLGSEQQADLAEIATVVPVDPPEEADDRDPVAFDQRGSVADRSIFASSLTQMREQLARDISAAVFVGGALTDFVGRYPGIAEEVALAMHHGRAVYLAGGFGGCVQRIIEAVTGGDPVELTLEYQLAHTDGYSDLLRHLPQSSVDYRGLVEMFRTTGVDGLRNGLSIEENQVLFSTDDVDQIIALVLKGLRTIPSAG